MNHSGFGSNVPLNSQAAMSRASVGWLAQVSLLCITAQSILNLLIVAIVEAI